MIDCPLKPCFSCRATVALILESRCLSCPEASRRIVNNPSDGFGREAGYRPDDFNRRTDSEGVVV